jgi:tyrosyl-tRNA synthetase
MMVGRDLVHKIKSKEKAVMAVKLLVDQNGKKMGKSEGNAIGLITPPEKLFGMLMTLGDETISTCFEQITTLSLEEVDQIKKRLESGENPMVLKKELAFTIVRELNSEEEAKKAKEAFENTFQKRNFQDVHPEEIPIGAVENQLLSNALFNSKILTSKSEIKRFFEQGAIEINGNKITNDAQVSTGDIIKVGKKQFLKIT